MTEIIKCADCGEEITKEKAWKVRIPEGEVIVCAKCLIKRNPEYARTYYYGYPYCEKCKKRLKSLKAVLCRACKNKRGDKA